MSYLNNVCIVYFATIICFYIICWHYNFQLIKKNCKNFSAPKTQSVESTESWTDVVDTSSRSPRHPELPCSSSRLTCPSTSPSVSNSFIVRIWNIVRLGCWYTKSILSVLKLGVCVSKLLGCKIENFEKILVSISMKVDVESSACVVIYATKIRFYFIYQSIFHTWLSMGSFIV